MMRVGMEQGEEEKEVLPHISSYTGLGRAQAKFLGSFTGPRRTAGADPTLGRGGISCAQL